MTAELRRSGAVSLALHGVILLALVLTLHEPSLPPTQDQSVTMEFATEAAQSQRAQTPAPTPAPAPADIPTPDQPNLDKALPTPQEAPPPLPPPPPPSPPAPQAVPVPTPPAPPPPTRTQGQAAPLTQAPAPPQAADLPLPLPPVPPPPAPTPPQAKPAPAPVQQAPKPDTRPPAPAPAPERPKPAERTTSTTSQPNHTRNPLEDSRTAEVNLDKLLSRMRQQQPPTHAYNPPRGGAIGGGTKTGIDNRHISSADRGAIGDKIRECWTRDAGARDADQMAALLRVTTDAGGNIRIVAILRAPSGTAGRAFAERAQRAALDPQCNPIPLPRTMLGENHTFEITFKP